ncbi:OsmC family peroxiredoxin [Mucilaginibacter sp.]|jgi:osmotically inducible protein OsmC|uniref:OsmC family peroxiredoxin n=1 Tax=Mucilaginibacter sp. TaxID=1882438 RepID=UPI00356621EA
MKTSTGISTWKGSWKQGTGTISTKSGVLKDQFVSFASRFEDAPGASPEELFAAAHAACFNQALANNAGMNKLETASIRTAADIVLGYDENTGHPQIKSLHFTVESEIPGATEEQFEAWLERARSGCTISKILNPETLTTTVTGKLIKSK